MRRIFALLLIVTMLINLVACSSQKDNEPASTEPRFYEMATFSTGLDNVNGWAGRQKILYADDECFVVIENFIVGIQDGIYGEFSDEDDDIYRVCKYSVKEENFGELIAEYDLKNFINIDENSAVISGIDDVACTPEGDLLIVYVPDVYNVVKNEQIITIDIDTGEILSESEPVHAQVPYVSNAYRNSPIRYCNGYFYIASTAWEMTEAYVHKYDMELNLIETYDINDYGDTTLSYVWDVRIIDNENFYIEASDVSGISRYFIYNVSTNSITPTTLSSSGDGFSLWDGEGAYFSDVNGIHKGNFATGELETIVDYNRCNVNRRIAGSGLSVLSVTDDKIICSKLDDSGYLYVVFYISGLYSFTTIETETSSISTDVSEPDITNTTETSDNNGVDPFEGKTPISIACISLYEPDPVIFDAIYEFNCTNTEYYIYLDNRYSVQDYVDADFENNYTSYIQSTEYKEAMRSGLVNLTNQLRVDIMAGNGPDIILDGYNYSQFNSDSVMVDLNSYIDNDPDFDRDGFFGAIFYTNTDGLYQIPYSASEYIITDNADAASYLEANNGMTLDNYRLYVDEVCNGCDPLRPTNLNRADYFVFLFNLSRDLFINNGRIDLDNAAFREIAEYCYDLPIVNMNYDEYSNMIWEQGGYGSFTSWGGGEFTNGRIGFGLPTPDGAPPMLLCKASVGITESCSCPDVAWEFVKILFSDTVQGSDNIPAVNIDYYRARLECFIAETNARANEGYPEDPTYIPPVYEEGAEDIIMAVLETADSMYMTDTDIDMILYEEIQAYLVGDRSLDDLIPIMEDRCQTVIDERE